MISEDILIPSGKFSIYLSRYRSSDKKRKECLVFAPGAWQYPGMYPKFINKISEKFDILAPNYIGHGKSIYEGSFLFDDLVKNVEDSIYYAAQNYDKVVLFGYSLGGIISSILATKEGLPLKGIVSNTIVVPEMEETYRQLIKLPLVKTRKGFLKLVKFFDMIQKMIKIRVPEWMFRVKEVGDRKLIGEMVKDPLSRKFYWNDFLISALKIKAKDFITKKVQYPFVMLASKKDKFIPFGYEEAIYEKVKAVSKDLLILDLPRETHIPLHEYPDEVSALLIPKFEKLFKS